MIEELEIETYLSISKNKFGIYLFDKKKMSTLFKEELNIVDQIEDLQLKKLSNFLDDNIFKIEKLMGNFINNIFVVIETDKIFTTNMSLKKKNYDKIIKFKILENLLTEAKDLFKENYQDYKIMHMLINKYIFNGEIHSNFINNLKSDYICLEINFICIPKKLSLEINQTLDKYQIKINKFLDNRYINSLFSDHEIETAHKFCKVLSGYNENEVNLVSKNQEKIGFFEKFFQLFS